MTKYCTGGGYGTFDNKTVLDLEDDVAHVKWGGDWRMPTYDEWDELRDKCTWTWTKQNGVDGYKVTGPNGNSIFLPAAGWRTGTFLDASGSSGLYWSSSLGGESCNAIYQHFSSGGRDLNSRGRCYGLSVRPVCD